MTDAARQRIVRAAAIILLTCAAFAPAVRNGFIWDDDQYVTQNMTLRDVPGLVRIWTEFGAVPQYYPLTHTTFWIEYQLWGLNPAGYHAVNILLHACNAVLVWLILSRFNVRGAWLAGAIFAVHPVMVESVAWITERKNVLSGLFFLLALWTYFPKPRALPGDDVREEGVLESEGNPPVAMPFGDSTRRAEPGAEGGMRARYWAALGLFVAALLCKTTAATLPPVILLIIWWRRGRLRWREDVVPTLPFFGVGLALSLVTIWMERTMVGAEGAAFDLSLIDRLIIAGRALWFYAWKLIWPASLTFIYPRWTLWPAQLCYPLAAIAVMIALILARHRIGRGPATAVLFFAGVLFPALGFINVYPMIYSFVADHFNYLAALGPITLVASSSYSLSPWERAGVRAERAKALLLPLLILTLLATLTFRQTHIYRDAKTLWQDTLAKNDRALIARINLGLIFIDEGDLAAATVHLNHAITINPNNPLTLVAMAKVRRAQSDDAGARLLLELVVKDHPTYPVAHLNLADILYARDPKNPRILEHLQQAIANKPANELPHAHYLLAVYLANQEGDDREVIRQLELALAIEPDHADAHYQLGLALARQNQYHAASDHLTTAIRLNPSHDRAKQALDAIRRIQQ